MPRSHRMDYRDTMLQGGYKVETLRIRPGDLLVAHPFLIHGGGAHEKVPVEINGGWTREDDYNIRGFAFADDVVKTSTLHVAFFVCVCMPGLCLWRANTHLCLHCRDIAGYLGAVEKQGALHNGCFR